MIKLGIIDRDLQFLEEFTAYFNNRSYVQDLEIFCSAQELRSYFKNKKRIDYLFIDYATVGASCISFIEEVKMNNRHIEIIISSNDFSMECVIKAFVAGASGFLPKELTFEEREEHLRNVIKGAAAITPQIAKELIAYFNPGPKKLNNNILNEKEHLIIRLMTDGHNYRKIAGMMNLSGHSVRYYMKQIYKKMNVKSKGEAIKKYLLHNNNLP